MHTHSPETPKRKILGSFYELSEESSEIGSSSKVLTKKSISIKSSRSIRTLKDLS